MAILIQTHIMQKDLYLRCCCWAAKVLPFGTPWTASTTGPPVLHHPSEFSQVHLHWVGNAIQPSHPLSSPSPLAFSIFQHQGLFQMSRLLASGGQSIGTSASELVLPMHIQSWFPLGLIGLISLQSKGLSEIKKCDASSFILFIQNCFAILLWFHTNYRIFFLLLLKNIIGILIVIALKSVDQSSIFG